MKPTDPIAAIPAQQLGPIRPTIIVARAIAPSHGCPHCGSRRLHGTPCCSTIRAQTERVRATRQPSRRDRLEHDQSPRGATLPPGERDRLSAATRGVSDLAEEKAGGRHGR